MTAAGTKIQSHCGTTNLRLTAHLGLVVPLSNPDRNRNPGCGNECRIRIAGEWYTWEEGRVLVFDDSFEHEVQNLTNSVRAVLLFRFWHPCISESHSERREALDQALQAKANEQLRRYNPPMPRKNGADDEERRFRLRAYEQSACQNCWSAGYESIRVVPSETGGYCFACSCGHRI